MKPSHEAKKSKKHARCTIEIHHSIFCCHTLNIYIYIYTYFTNPNKTEPTVQFWGGYRRSLIHIPKVYTYIWHTRISLLLFRKKTYTVRGLHNHSLEFCVLFSPVRFRRRRRQGRSTLFLKQTTATRKHVIRRLHVHSSFSFVIVADRPPVLPAFLVCLPTSLPSPLCSCDKTILYETREGKRQECIDSQKANTK